MRNSGAGTILLPYRVHGLGYAETLDEVNQAMGSVGNPVTGLAIVNGVLIVTFADGSTQDLTLPAGGGGDGDGVDQFARDAAAQAQADASAAGSVASAASGAASTAQGTADTALARGNEARTEAATAQSTADGAQTEITEHEEEHEPGTQVFVSITEPSGGEYRLDDVWIRDVTTSPWQIYKWTGTVWSSYLHVPWTHGATASGFGQGVRNRWQHHAGRRECYWRLPSAAG